MFVFFFFFFTGTTMFFSIIIIIIIIIIAITSPCSMSCTFHTPMSHTSTMCDPAQRGATESLFEATLGHNPSATG